MFELVMLTGFLGAVLSQLLPRQRNKEDGKTFKRSGPDVGEQGESVIMRSVRSARRTKVCRSTTVIAA
jgi:hypothetical protein